MRGIPSIIMELLGWGGIAIGNALLASLPIWMRDDDWMRNIITGAALGIVVNLGSFLYLCIVSLLRRSGISMDIITAVVVAAEEQFGPDSGRGSDKLEAAIALLQEKLKQNKLGFFAAIGFKLFARPLISALAPRVKHLLYSQPGG